MNEDPKGLGITDDELQIVGFHMVKDSTFKYYSLIYIGHWECSVGHRRLSQVALHSITVGPAALRYHPALSYDRSYLGVPISTSYPGYHLSQTSLNSYPGYHLSQNLNSDCVFFILFFNRVVKQILWVLNLYSGFFLNWTD